MPEIDLSQVPLPPPLPNQKGNDGKCKEKSSNQQSLENFNVTEVEERIGSKRKKKKKRKGQDRTQSIAEFEDHIEVCFFIIKF